MALVGLDVASNDSQKFILIMMTITAAAVVTEKLAGSSEVSASYIQIFIGLMVATMLLEAISYVIPEFASGLAVVAMITVIFTKGQIFWSAIAKVTGGTTTTTTTSPSSTGTTQKPNTSTAGGRG
jgi:hypothetical protein